MQKSCEISITKLQKISTIDSAHYLINKRMRKKDKKPRQHSPPNEIHREHSLHAVSHSAYGEWNKSTDDANRTDRTPHIMRKES